MKHITSSLSHFTGKERYALHCIRKQLMKEARPDLILYLGSLATTTLQRNQSAIEDNKNNFRYACELLLAIPTHSALYRNNENIRALEERLLAWGDVRLIVFSPEELVEQLRLGRNPHITLHTPAIVLYEKDNALRRILKQVQSNKAVKPPVAVNDEAPFSPISLASEERREPMKAIQAFFREYSLPEVRQHIAQWMNAVLHRPSWLVEDTGTHLSFYESVSRLMEVAWRLRYMEAAQQPRVLQDEPAGDILPARELYCPHDGADAWDFFPHHLSREEFCAPYAVFQKLFRIRGLREWQRELHELFSLSLSALTPQELGVVHDTQGVARQLNRLAEACHLLWVWQRQADKPAAVVKAPVSSVL